MRSLEIDRPFSYLNLLLIIAPQLVLFVLYVVEKASRNLGQKKILWGYNYNNDTFLLERYFIPLLTLLVYVLAFLIPLYFRNVLGVLYLLFILARAYLSIRSRINRLSTLLILAYFAFFITRNIWPTESLYVSFLLDPKTASFDFVLAIVLVDLLHDLGSFIHMYMKLKRKNLQIIRKQSSIYRDMVTSTPAQSNFKRYYLRHFERVVNKNFKKINSWSVNKFFDYQVELNCVFVSGDKANRLYDDDENREYSKGQLLPLLRREAPSREDQPQEEVIEERGSVDLESDFRETKSEDFEVKPEKKEETAPPEDEDESKSDLTEVGLPKKKRKKIRTVLWEMTKKAFDFVLNFPIWEFLLNIFGSDLVFYFYIGEILHLTRPNQSRLRGLLPNKPFRARDPAVHHHPQLLRLGVFKRVFPQEEDREPDLQKEPQHQREPDRLGSGVEAHRETRQPPDELQPDITGKRERHAVPLHLHVPRTRAGLVAADHLQEDQVLL